jgi:hypothetical protein
VNIFVLYDRAGIHSGRALGESLKSSLVGANVETGRPERLAQLVRSGKKYNFVVNVGWFGAIEAGDAVVLNRPSAIAVSSNKLRARRKFVEKGVSAPGLWEDPSAIPANSYPVIGRTTHHSKGKGFFFCKNPSDAHAASRGGVVIKKRLIRTRKGNRVWRDRKVVSQGATHFIKFIPNTREFRAHVICSKADLKDATPEDFLILKLSEKLPGPDGTKNTVIKNHDNGWIFSFPKDSNDPILDKVREAGKKAIAAFGLHWGAVDIVVSKDTREVYVLEINSTPCLTDDSANTIDKYVRGVGALTGLMKPLKTKKEKAQAKVQNKAPSTKKNLGSLLAKVGV